MQAEPKISAVDGRSRWSPLRLPLGATRARLSDHELFQICQMNRDWRIERTSDGEIVAEPPAGGLTGKRNFQLTGMFAQWVAQNGTGVGFDSSTGFVLANGAERSPDLAWVSRLRWDALTDQQKEEFPPLCPDFVAELRSRSDSLAALRAKMREYIANGARLGWLIDPVGRRVYVYRPPDKETRLDDPESISGDPVLPGFVLQLRQLWD
jgi:Uma2 family endonuclease